MEQTLLQQKIKQIETEYQMRMRSSSSPKKSHPHKQETVVKFDINEPKSHENNIDNEMRITTKNDDDLDAIKLLKKTRQKH